jgi:hypothetical protein
MVYFLRAKPNKTYYQMDKSYIFKVKETVKYEKHALLYASFVVTFCTERSWGVNTHPVGCSGANGDSHYFGWELSLWRWSQFLDKPYLCGK